MGRNRDGNKGFKLNGALLYTRFVAFICDSLDFRPSRAVLLSRTFDDTNATLQRNRRICNKLLLSAKKFQSYIARVHFEYFFHV